MRVEIYSYSRIRRSHRKKSNENNNNNRNNQRNTFRRVLWLWSNIRGLSLFYSVYYIYLFDSDWFERTVKTSLCIWRVRAIAGVKLVNFWVCIPIILATFLPGFFVILVIESGMERIGFGENFLMHVHCDIAAFKARHSLRNLSMCWHSLRINSSSISRAVSVHIYILTKERAVITLGYI